MDMSLSTEAVGSSHTAAKAARSGTSQGEGFFLHHGLLAPGVRLFRRLQFSAKAAVIIAVSFVPVVLLFVWQTHLGFDEALRIRAADLQQQAQALQRLGVTSLARDAVDTEARAGLIATVAELNRTSTGVHYWVVDDGGRMLADGSGLAPAGAAAGSVHDAQGLAPLEALVGSARRGDAHPVQWEWMRDDARVLGMAAAVSDARSGLTFGLYAQSQPFAATLLSRVATTAWLVAVLIGLVSYLFYCFYHVINGGLQKTQYHLHSMTTGDLTTTPNPWGNDEPARLMLDLRDMQDALVGIVSRVRASSDDILHSSAEVANGAAELSNRTRQTAHNLERSAASMEQISATIKGGAQHTQEVAQLAEENCRIAEDGARGMEEVTHSMESILEASRKISEIISAIDGIAFQTNILALNAAVEAARAGDQGRGFAVVASEVRVLALRSTEAAKQIKDIITSSVAEAQNGNQVVSRVGSIIQQMLQSTHRVSHVLAEIATGSREQSVGVSQIGDSVQELDRITQQNSALVEETSAAAAAMKRQADQLAEHVSQFKLPASAAAVRTQDAPANVENFDFDKAIEAHRAWKVKLRKAIANQEKIDADTLSRDNVCPLGKWIHGAGGVTFGQHAEFGNLREMHRRFHICAGGVARKINLGGSPDLASLLDAGSEFSQISTAVITSLTKAKHGF